MVTDMTFKTFMTLDPVLSYTLTLSFSFLFMMASLNKWQYRQQFLAVLTQYQVVPTKLLNITSLALPLIEAAISIGLLIEITRAFAAMGAMALLLAYALGMALNLHRGATQLDCGCNLSPNRRETTLISKGLVGRNFILLMLAQPMLLPVTERTMSIADGGLILFGVVMLSLAYATINQLLHNHSRYQEIR